MLEKAVLIQNTEVDTMVDTHLPCAPEPATRVSELETNFYILLNAVDDLEKSSKVIIRDLDFMKNDMNIIRARLQLGPRKP